MSGFQLQRLGLIMEPEPGNSLEVEGTLNPAAVRGVFSDRPAYRPGGIAGFVSLEAAGTGYV